MSFLDKIEQYIKLGPWLTMVGALIALFSIGFMSGHLLGFKGLAFLGMGIAVAGRLYNQVYP